MSKRSSTAQNPEDIALAKGLPANVEAERAVLGSILLSGTGPLAEARSLLEAEDFVLEKHRRIYRAMLEVADDGEPVDAVTLATRLMFHGQLESCDGPVYLSGLTELLPRYENIEAYCRIVKEAAERRRIIHLAQCTAAMALEDGAHAEQVAAQAVSQLIGIGQRVVRTQTFREVVDGFAGGVDRLLNPSLWAKGIETGLRGLDEMLVGLQNDDLIILAARPSMGKTALALGIAAHVAKNGKRVVMFSLEMGKVSLLHRLVCMIGRVDMHRMRGGFLGREERQRLMGALTQIVDWPFHVDDTAGSYIEQIRAECERLRVQYGRLDLILVDYLQLIGTRGRADNKNQELATITKALKQLAREHKMPVITLSQLSRAPETRTGDHRPRLSDLRESGAIEQDADVVIFIFREEVYKQDREDLHGLAELIIAKQRNGPIGKVEVSFLHKYARFENRASGYDDPPPPAESFFSANSAQDRV